MQTKDAEAAEAPRFVAWGLALGQVPWTYADKGSGHFGASVRLGTGPGSRFAKTGKKSKAKGVGSRPIRVPGQRTYSSALEAHEAAYKMLKLGPEFAAIKDFVRRGGVSMLQTTKLAGDEGYVFFEYASEALEGMACRYALGLVACVLVVDVFCEEARILLLARLFEIEGRVESVPWPKGVTFAQGEEHFGVVRSQQGAWEETADPGKTKFFGHLDSARGGAPVAPFITSPIAAYRLLAACRADAPRGSRVPHEDEDGRGPEAVAESEEEDGEQGKSDPEEGDEGGSDASEGGESEWSSDGATRLPTNVLEWSGTRPPLGFIRAGARPHPAGDRRRAPRGGGAEESEAGEKSSDADGLSSDEPIEWSGTKTQLEWMGRRHPVGVEPVGVYPTSTGVGRTLRSGWKAEESEAGGISSSGWKAAESEAGGMSSSEYESGQEEPIEWSGTKTKPGGARLEHYGF